MNLWIRLLRVLIAALFRPRLGYLAESVVDFRVLPHDLDINIHMTNSRYLALMDLGRFDLILRTGLWRAIGRHRWQPVVAGSLVRFRRPLAPFQPCRVRTRLLTWDEKWLYLQHSIDSKGVPACQAHLRTAFVHRGQVVPPADIARAMGCAEPPPPLPDWIRTWRDAETGFEPLSPPPL